MTAEQPIADGAVITYSLLFNPATNQFVQQGERPHCAMWHLVSADQCQAMITVWDMTGPEDAQCTREAGHHGPHVVHERPGLPLLAWLVKR